MPPAIENPTLRDQLVGAWKLVSYVEVPVDGSASRHPFGEKPKGIIMYTPDGFMSAQLSAAVREPFASGDWFNGTDADFRGEASSYIAYSGPFHVDENNQTLMHTMFVSLFPNWAGHTQARIVELEGDMLTLSTASPVTSGGKLVNARLVWERAKKTD